MAIVASFFRPSLANVISVSALLSACVPGDPARGIRGLEAVLSPDVGLVVELFWDSQAVGDAWVEFGTSEDRSRSTPVTRDDGTHHTARLLGLPPLSTVYYEVFTDEGDGVVSKRGEIVTDGLPPGLPELSLEVHPGRDVSSEPYLLAAVLGVECFVLAVDRSGEVLWYRTITAEQHRKMPVKVAFDDFSSGLVVGNFFMDFLALVSQESPASSDALFLDMGGELVDQWDLGVAHHDLVQLPDGSMATLGVDVRDWYDPERDEQVTVMGDILVLVEPDGERTELFNTWDWSEPWVHDRFYQMSEEYADWTHGNGLSYDSASDCFLLSLGLLDTILEISRSTGEVLREFGPDGYAVQDGRSFVYQHGPHWTEQGTLLMSSWVGSESRVMAIEYEVDDEAGVLEQVWSYGENEGFTSMAGGQALRMDNGNTLINTGYLGLLVEVSPEGQPVWELASSMGHVFTSVSFFEDFYRLD